MGRLFGGSVYIFLKLKLLFKQTVINTEIKDTDTKNVPTEKHNNSINEVALRFL